MKITFVSSTSISIELSGTVNLSTTDVEQLITHLGDIRKSMEPKISVTLPDGTYNNQLIDPRWALLPLPASGDTTLAIRHDGLGWLLFLLPKSEAQKLGHGLLSQSLYEPSFPNSPTGLPH